MGRPVIINNKSIDRLIEAFAIGCSDDEACTYANISPATLYNYQRKNPTFYEHKKALKLRPVLKARIVVYRALSDPAYAWKFLNNKTPSSG